MNYASQDLQGYIQNEVDFLKEQEFEVTLNGNYIFDSRNSKQTIDLPFILADYKEFLIRNKIVKEL